jgi:membrane associated rhomboid family serine protease
MRSRGITARVFSVNEFAPETVIVCSGTRAHCNEHALVLEARALPCEWIETETGWALAVAPELAAAARDELQKYAAERAAVRPAASAPAPFAGASLGAAAYVLVLLTVAYCAGAHCFRSDWFDAGALESAAGSAHAWWRAITALTLHVDPAHLLDNLFFGVGIGVLAGRLLGPGLAWAGILAAGAAANYLEMLIAPADHRAVGASTAVFAGLGLLSGYAWRQLLPSRQRWLYRWAPLFAGICLLALLGAGSGQVDVLGHGLGFVAGVGLGWILARAGMPRSRRPSVQVALGAAAGMAVVVAWGMALRS